MSKSNALMILAVIVGPILAVQAQKFIEKWREARARKVWIFKTLMAMRGTPLAPAFVQALNTIDLEFSPKKPKEKAVLDAWKLYLDHLYSAPRDFNDPNYQSQLTVWTAKSSEWLVDLLYLMGRALGYNFDKVQLKKGFYTPVGHTNLELEQSLIRRGILEVLFRRRNLPVELVQPPPPQQPLPPQTP